jgi:DNA modification methylase
MTVRIICADVMDGLRQLPNESVHCVVTSPPYWGLRDYGVDGQIGLEPSLGEHIDRMVAVFREVRRVLRADGTLWLNYGDCYATSVNGRSAADTKAAGNDDRTFRDKPFSTIGPIYAADPRDEDRRGSHSTLLGGAPHHTPGRVVAGGTLKPKDLCMIPHRLAIALQDDGWWVRMDIVWAKPNPMPESIKDRPTKAHEYVFLLTKSERYAYDAEAIKEAASFPDGPNAPNAIASPYGQGFTRRAGKNEAIAASVPDRRRGHARKHQGFNERWDAMERAEQCSGMRNKRSVWTIATAPFPEAHFATFPPELPEICIKAGCPVGGTVLDPFSGAGTTCLVADRLQRNAIGIELNPEYAAMSERRINGDRGALLDLMEAAE